MLLSFNNVEDITPVFLNQLVLIDFGLAKKFHGISLTPISIPLQFGTYLSPERRLNKVSIDLYGLGATCFHLLSGRHPNDLIPNFGNYSNRDDYTWTHGLRNYLNSPISESLKNVISKLLQQRYQSAKEAYEEIPRLPNVTTSASQTSNWRCTKTLSEHNAYVYSIAITLDGKTLVSGDDDGRINIWNLDTEELLYALPSSENSASVKSMTISPDGQKFASSASTKINLWNNLHTTLSNLPFTIKNLVSVNALAFDPNGDYLASGGGERINLWLPDGERLAYTLYADQNDYPDWYEPEDSNDSPSYSVTCVNFSPNGRMLVAGISITAPDGETDLGNNIKIWNPYTGELLYVLPGHSRSSVMSIAFSPDGKTLASGGFDGKIKLWDVSTWTEKHIIKEHFGAVCALAFSSDGKTLASGSMDNVIKLWNPYTGMRLQRLTAHTGSVNSLAFSANRQTLVSGSSDGTIKIWRCD